MTVEHPRRGRPKLGLAVGDPAGIGPELAVKLLADTDVRAAADLVVVGDRNVLEREAGSLGLGLDVPVRSGPDALAAGTGTMILDLGHLDLARLRLGVASKEGGRFALLNFNTCLELAVTGHLDGVCFTPFNKAAMHMAHPSYTDESGYAAETLGRSDLRAREFNVLDNLWNARITSHVPLSAVPALVTQEAVLDGIRATEQTLRQAGFVRPRIAVAALNPHAGDGGNFGHEDDAIIVPAVLAAQAEGIAAQGPYPSDTVFLRALKGAFDAVVTMYHDQGQIAMKLIGFDRGVTLLAGFPFPICTPAHGSAYDIAGQGIADPGASRAAVLLAARMARTGDRQTAHGGALVPPAVGERSEGGR